MWEIVGGGEVDDANNEEREGKHVRVRDGGRIGGLRDWLRQSDRNVKVQVETVEQNTDTYTVAINVSRIHSAASRSPPRPSLAIHESKSSRIMAILP